MCPTNHCRLEEEEEEDHRNGHFWKKIVLTFFFFLICRLFSFVVCLRLQNKVTIIFFLPFVNYLCVCEQTKVHPDHNHHNHPIHTTQTLSFKVIKCIIYVQKGIVENQMIIIMMKNHCINSVILLLLLLFSLVVSPIICVSV